jgi:hypothetical protein
MTTMVILHWGESHEESFAFDFRMELIPRVGDTVIFSLPHEGSEEIRGQVQRVTWDYMPIDTGEVSVVVRVYLLAQCPSDRSELPEAT